RSGLALAGANRAGERAGRGLSDGLLTALEVQNLDLWGTELVVLSACETGFGAVSDVGEGVLGLRREFQNAGARTVLAALWKVPARAPGRLVPRSFAGWRRGPRRGGARRRAQGELTPGRREAAAPKRHPAPPLYWAGFVLHGQAE